MCRVTSVSRQQFYTLLPFYSFFSSTIHCFQHVSFLLFLSTPHLYYFSVPLLFLLALFSISFFHFRFSIPSLNILLLLFSSFSLTAFFCFYFVQFSSASYPFIPLLLPLLLLLLSYFFHSDSFSTRSPHFSISFSTFASTSCLVPSFFGQLFNIFFMYIIFRVAEYEALCVCPCPCVCVYVWVQTEREGRPTDNSNVDNSNNNRRTEWGMLSVLTICPRESWGPPRERRRRAEQRGARGGVQGLRGAWRALTDGIHGMTGGEEGIIVYEGRTDY